MSSNDIHLLNGSSLKECCHILAAIAFDIKYEKYLAP